MTADGAPQRGDPGADHGADAVEQLQRALLTLIGAARVTLDALEAAVADRSRLDHLAAGGRDLVGALWSAVQGRAPDDENGSDTPKP